MFFFVLLLLVPVVFGAIIISNKPIDPKDANLHYITGNALYNIDEYTESIKHFKQAVNINPDFEEAHNNLAYLYNKAGEYKRAAEHLVKLTELNPNNPSYHYDYAINLVMNIKDTKQGKIEEIEEAIKEFEIVESIEPGFLKAKENLEFLKNMRNEYYSG